MRMGILNKATLALTLSSTLFTLHPVVANEQPNPQELSNKRPVEPKKVTDKTAYPNLANDDIYKKAFVKMATAKKKSIAASNGEGDKKKNLKQSVNINKKAKTMIEELLKNKNLLPAEKEHLEAVQTHLGKEIYWGIKFGAA